MLLSPRPEETKAAEPMASEQSEEVEEVEEAEEVESNPVALAWARHRAGGCVGRWRRPRP